MPTIECNSSRDRMSGVAHEYRQALSQSRVGAWGSRCVGVALGCALFLGLPVIAQSVAPPATGAQLAVVGFKVSGNTLLPQEHIDAVLNPFKGQRTAAELKQAALAVQDLYARAGYGGVVASLPEQSVADGVVNITVVEGRVARVLVTGNKHFDSQNIHASVPALAVGATPPLKRIDAQIQLANDNPAKQVEVLLQPGQHSGEIDASLAVIEQRVQRWNVQADNTGTHQTGRLRAGVGWQHADLSGRDDVLSMQFLTSPTKPSKVKVVSAGYHLPLYALTSALDAFAAHSDIDGGTTGTLAGDVRFSGRGRLFGVRGTRYLERAAEWDQRIGLGLDHRDYLNQCGVAGLPEGACGPAGESVSVQPISLEYSAQRIGAVRVALAVSLHRNLQWGGGRSSDDQFEAVRTGAKPHYTLMRLSVSGAAEVAQQWQLQARFAGQFTSDALVPGEQFGIGGIGSVRGYEERELAGDRGAFASLELLAPPLLRSVTPSGSSLRPSAFVDVGQLSNRLGAPCLRDSSHCTLASVGAGLRYAAGDFAARLFVANALKAGVRTENKDVRAHVAVSYGF